METIGPTPAVTRFVKFGPRHTAHGRNQTCLKLVSISALARWKGFHFTLMQRVAR